MRICSETDCGTTTYGRGLCRSHYNRARYNGTIELHERSLVPAGSSLEDRLRHHGWTVTDVGCWEWDGYREAGGYGLLAIGRGRPERASRAAYAAWVGEIPPEGVVCHRCDNPPCINPAHLFLGDRAVNNADMAAKKRSANGTRKMNWLLTDAQVDELRALYATGTASQRAIAKQYGVSQQLVSMIVRRHRRQDETHGSI